MPLMLSKTYDALISAGAPDDKAREAAEELADYENRLSSIDNKLAVIDGRFIAIEGRLAALEGKLNVVIWAIGINAAATIAILGVLLRHA
ncbi:MAG TPA: hypothetical protein VNV39_00315 [Stellaceae bacterium]|nr:hypothetical protein [Stellaceae bacterium]